MIKTLKDLSDFFKLCRKQGVTDITCEGFSVKFGEIPKKAKQEDSDEEEGELPQQPTIEELMNWNNPHENIQS